MHAPFDNIVQHLFHQPSLLSVTVGELERMAEQHPYFAAAHFLLLKKMQDTDHPQFSTQLHKTTLYFNNPLWLQFLLQPERVSNFKVLDKAPFISNETVEVPVHVHQGEEHHQQVYESAEPVMQEQTSDFVHQHIETANHAPVAEPPASIMDVITEVFHEPGETHQETIAREEIVNTPAKEEITPNEPGHYTETGKPSDAENAEASIDNVSERTIEVPLIDAESVENTPAETIHEPEITELPEEHVDTVMAAGETVSFQDENAMADEESTAIGLQELYDSAVYAEEAKATEHNEITPVQEIIQPAEQTVVAEEPDALSNEETVNGTAEAGATSAVPEEQQVAPISEKPLLRIIETSAAQEDMLFEPYHTVDYFASQGIKLGKSETDAKDSFGRKLRSFTDWLKTMKKLPQASVENMLAKNDESKVVEDAIHSIENKEVITEAMAEVFEKQGMNDKAAEVYRKLSLLNPAKSAYFAAKIDLLKQ